MHNIHSKNKLIVSFNVNQPKNGADKIKGPWLIAVYFFNINFVLSFKRIKWSQKAAYIPALEKYIEKVSFIVLKCLVWSKLCMFKKLRSTLTTQNEALTQCNGRVAKI